MNCNQAVSAEVNLGDGTKGGFVKAGGAPMQAGQAVVLCGHRLVLGKPEISSYKGHSILVWSVPAPGGGFWPVTQIIKPS